MNDSVAPRAIGGAAHQREPHICVCRRCHFRRHYPDDGGAQVIKSNGAANHGGVALKNARPKSIADDREEWTARFIFFFGERSTELGSQPDYLEKVCRDDRRTDFLGAASGNIAQGDGFVPSQRKIFENGVVMPPVEIVRQ